jgi:hypothetical protein
MYLRYTGLFLLTGVGGIVSGFMWLVPSGLMGGALGMSLSVGTLWLGQKQARTGVVPSERYALATGAGVGLLGGVCMAAIAILCRGRTHYDFAPPVLPVWAPLVMGVLYGMVLLWSYYGRLTARRPLWHTLLKACGLCFLLKAVAAFSYVTLTEHTYSELLGVVMGSVFVSLLGAVPFALFWVLATAWLDPAWGSRLTQGRPKSRSGRPDSILAA